MLVGEDSGSVVLRECVLVNDCLLSILKYTISHTCSMVPGTGISRVHDTVCVTKASLVGWARWAMDYPIIVVVHYKVFKSVIT